MKATRIWDMLSSPMVHLQGVRSMKKQLLVAAALIAFASSGMAQDKHTQVTPDAEVLITSTRMMHHARNSCRRGQDYPSAEAALVGGLFNRNLEQQHPEEKH